MIDEAATEVFVTVEYVDGRIEYDIPTDDASRIRYAREPKTSIAGTVADITISIVLSFIAPFYELLQITFKCFHDYKRTKNEAYKLTFIFATFPVFYYFYVGFLILESFTLDTQIIARDTQLLIEHESELNCELLGFQSTALILLLLCYE